MIKQFLRDVDWGEIDYLLIDTPPGTSDEHLSIAQYLKESDVDGAIVITTPQVKPSYRIMNDNTLYPNFFIRRIFTTKKGALWRFLTYGVIIEIPSVELWMKLYEVILTEILVEILLFEEIWWFILCLGNYKLLEWLFIFWFLF